MRSWLKAGLIGGGVLSVLTILGYVGTLLPQGAGTVISCCICIPAFLAYPGAGALAAWWLSPPRTAGAGAKEGVLAGLVAGALSGIVTIIMGLIGGNAASSQLESLRRSLEAAGMSQLASLYTPSGMAVLSAAGSCLGLIWAAAWGAIGGAILAAVKKE